MTDVVEFLRARLNEDEEVAQAASPGGWCYGDVASVAGGTLYDETRRIADLVYEQIGDHDGSITRHLLVPEADANGAHIARHDPARVLAEVEAKRRIVELHEMIPETMYRTPWIPEDPGSYDVMVCAICGIDDDRPVLAGPCATLRLLALPYAGHPGYDEERHI